MILVTTPSDIDVYRRTGEAEFEFIPSLVNTNVPNESFII
jgi:hypothetical protein